MNGHTPPLKAVYQQTTKSLNTGAQNTSIAAATGWVFYLTAPNGTVLMLQNSSITLPNSFGTGVIITHLNTGGPAPVLSDQSGVGSPTALPVLTATGSGSSLTGGTYQLAYAYTSPMGVSGPSPIASITITSGQDIQVAAIPAPTTTYVVVELAVPRLEDWHVTRYAVLVSSANSVPSVNLYVDSISQIYLLDTTALGAQNSGNADLYLRPGQIMIAQWFGIDIGAVATLSVFGEKSS